MRDDRIDIIKGFAIISVVILHTLSSGFMASIYRIFHIHQAVPIFMMVSGYVFALSYRNKDIYDLRECYDVAVLSKRHKRLYVPFLLVFLLEIFLSNNLNILFVAKNLLNGGFGPGSYYPIIMLQFIFLFPVIYFLVTKYKDRSIPMIFIAAIGFEIIVYILHVDSAVYRVLIGRYIFAIALGSYFALNWKSLDKRLIYGGSILGIIYAYASVYLNYNVFGHNYWLPHQAPLYFYTALLFYLAMTRLPEKSGIILSSVKELGKASWHIFLIQMLYFWKMGAHYDNTSAVVLNLIFCLSAGYYFYKAESYVYKYKSQSKTPVTN